MPPVTRHGRRRDRISAALHAIDSSGHYTRHTAHEVTVVPIEYARVCPRKCGFKHRNIDSYRGVYGLYEYDTKTVLVNVDKHDTDEELESTIIHEFMHHINRGRKLFTEEDEVLAVLAEDDYMAHCGYREKRHATRHRCRAIHW